jgi:hypothetical protein
MGLRARILKVVQPEFGGPRSKAVLSGLARPGQNFERIFKQMREAGELIRYRKRKGALYGLPKNHHAGPRLTG